MKHAVIVGHPDPASFNLSIAHAYCEAVRELGHEAVLRDLYRMDFDPRLKANERPDASGFTLGQDILAEQSILRDCDVFVFVYPLWLNSPPAIIKGYIERVFGTGFGYGLMSEEDIRPQLQNRMMLSFSSSGSRKAWLSEQGAWSSLLLLFDDYLARVCGWKVIDHVHFNSVTVKLADRWVKEHIATVHDKVRRHFGATTS